MDRPPLRQRNLTWTAKGWPARVAGPHAEVSICGRRTAKRRAQIFEVALGQMFAAQVYRLRHLIVRDRAIRNARAVQG